MILILSKPGREMQKVSFVTACEDTVPRDQQ